MATNAQLQALWIQAGGDPTKAAVAAAIAMAESGGNANARNPSTGSIGYWQINPQAHPPSQATADPLGNARAAVAISNNGRNWQPWQAFTNGSYRQFLNGADAAGATQNTASAGGGNWVADLFAPIFGTVGNWLIDAGMIVGGLVVFIWGTTVTILSTKEGKQLASNAVGGVLTVATGGSVKAATVGAVASAHVANKRSKAAAVRSEQATADRVESGPRNRRVIEGQSEQRKQADTARTSRQKMES